MNIQVNRDPRGRLYLEIDFSLAPNLIPVITQRGYKLDTVLQPKPTQVVFVLSPGAGPKAANQIIQFLRDNYAVHKLTWKTR